MSIENVGYISDLNQLWAAQGDTPVEGAGHIRVIKTALKNSFPNIDGEVTLTPDELNGLVDRVAACVLKAGDTMSGNLLMTDYKGVEFALTEDGDVFGRVVGRDSWINIEILDSGGTVLNTFTIDGTDAIFSSVATGVTPDGTRGADLVTVDYVNQVMIIEDRKARGVSGGASSNSSWAKRDLQTIIYNGIPGASLVSNEIILPIGVYEVEISAPAYKSDRHTTRLVDASGPFTVLIGSAEKANEGDEVTTRSMISGVITLAAETTLYLEHYTVWGDSNGLGVATDIHDAGEIYSQAKFRKL